MTKMEHDCLREALTLYNQQKDLDRQKAINDALILKMIRKSKNGVIRVVVDDKILTLAENKGQNVGLHISDLDCVLL